ncbi:MAG: hypothetical protein FWE70_01915 [Oscillospiraceae bacterium]|nr:hypothetical protein [Oscillospiraceae bacterium]
MPPNLTSRGTLSLKPDYPDTVRRYEAFWNGDLIDRPIVRIHGVKAPGIDIPHYPDDYYARMHDEMDGLVRGLVGNARRHIYYGEAIPSAYLSFGCDEIAAFCGGRLLFTEGSRDTSWSEPFVDDWEDAFPIRLDEDNPLWLRMQAFMDACAEAMEGAMVFSPVDTHSNMDLLLAMRGAERLCTDLLDRPETVDEAMRQTMGVFGGIHERMFRRYGLPAANGVTLQCDFSCMVGTDMFRRFALPYLELEAEYFGGRTFYHWDGVEALRHTDDLIASKGLYAMAFVPGYGNGDHKDFLDLYRKIQDRGKAISVWGSPDECKLMHGALRPEMTVYDTHVGTAAEAEALLDWFVRNT